MKILLSIIALHLHLLYVFGDAAFDYCTLNDKVCEGKRHIACSLGNSAFNRIAMKLVAEYLNNTTVKLSDNEKDEVLNFANLQRNRIALGETDLPKSSNLVKTVWDDELELFAKSLAETYQLTDYNDQLCYRRRNGHKVYHNLLNHKINPRTPQEAIHDILQNINNQIDPKSPINELKEASFLTKLGCYFSYTSDTSSDKYEGSLVCVNDYGMERELTAEAYVEGEPCSNCENNAGCDSNYAGLCATS